MLSGQINPGQLVTLFFWYEACEGVHKFYFLVLNQWWESTSGTPAGEFCSLHHGVDRYGQGVKLVSLLGGEEIDGSVSCNKEAWINKQSKLSEMVSWFLVVLR